MIEDVGTLICKKQRSWDLPIGDECSPDTSLEVFEEAVEISFSTKTKSGKLIHFIIDNRELPLTYVDEKQGNHETTLAKISEFIKQKYNCDYFTLECTSAYFGYILRCESHHWTLYGITNGYA